MMDANADINAPRHIAIHGNIGVGKTTLLKVLKRKGYRVVPEPVEAWGDALAQFYEDPKANAFLLQARILAELCAEGDRQMAVKASDCKDGIIFFERSRKGAQVFINAAVEDGNMSAEQLNSYKRLEEEIMRFRKHQTPENVVLQLNAETCCKRVQKRDRAGEKDGPLMKVEADRLRYLQLIEKHQQKLFHDATHVPAHGSPDDVAERFLAAIGV